MDIKAIAKRLCHLGYAVINAELGGLDDATLLRLLDSASHKVGDSAAELLGARKSTGAIVDAIVGDRITTRLGRIRATNVLLCRGKSVPRCEEAYLHLLDDRVPDVVSGGLFGLVFLQNQANIPKIEAARERSHAGAKADAYFEKALKALRAKDPFIYSLGFHDLQDVWGMDKERFGNRVG